MVLGALGGVTVVALILNRNKFRPSVVFLWLLFVIIAVGHTLLGRVL